MVTTTALLVPSAKTAIWALRTATTFPRGLDYSPGFCYCPPPAAGGWRNLNRGIAAERGLRLEVYRWETDASPGFHADGPQGLIDSVICIEDCDVLMAFSGSASAPSRPTGGLEPSTRSK